MLDEAIEQLIELGRAGRDGVPPAMADPEAAWSFLHEGCMPRWRKLASEMPEDRLEALIRGLVHFSRVAGSLGGSVSPVIWLFAVYAARFPQDEAALARWVIANRVNPYEPFGSAHTPASSMAEFWRWRFAGLQRARDNKQAEVLRRREAAMQRATLRLAAAVRRGDRSAVAALLAKGGDPAKALPNGSLVDLALAHGRTAVAELLKERGVR